MIPKKCRMGIFPVPEEDSDWRLACTHPVVLSLTAGCTLLRTDRDGWIEVVTDGQELEISVEHR